MPRKSGRQRRRTFLRGCGVFLVIAGGAAPAWSAPPAPMGLKAPGSTASRPPAQRELPMEGALPAAESRMTTVLDIELLIDDSSLGVDSQSWGRTFESLGHSARLRSSELQDEPGIAEKVRGPLRVVRIVGRLDRRGVISFPGKTFKQGQERELKEWLDELEVYGAQGSPRGKPQWGLNQKQAEDFLKLMAAPVEVETLGQPLRDIAKQIGFGKDIPLRAHTSVAAQWESADNPLTALQEVRGLSRGAGLAALLADHGLCARPIRTPKGTIEFVIQSRDEIDDPWPVGWEAPLDVQQSALLPEMFAFRPIGFPDRPLAETLEAAQRQTGELIVYDHWKGSRKGIDLYTATYGFPQKRAAWILVLKSAIGPSGLVTQTRIDEAGRSFLLVKPFEQPAPRKTK